MDNISEKTILKRIIQIAFFVLTTFYPLCPLWFQQKSHPALVRKSGMAFGKPDILLKEYNYKILLKKSMDFSFNLPIFNYNINLFLGIL